MPLVKCPECSREISDQVKACPHCGFPLPKPSINKNEADSKHHTRKPQEIYDLTPKNNNDTGITLVVRLIVTALAGSVYGSLTNSPLIGMISFVVLSFILLGYFRTKRNIADRHKYVRFIFGWKGVATYTILIIIIAISQHYYINYTKTKLAEAKQATSLENSRKSFVQAKSLLSQEQNISDDQWIAIQNLLTSVTKESPEYKEAKKQLSAISVKISEIQESRRQAEIRRQLAEEKAQKEKEEAGLTAKGKRLRAKHPEWSVYDCDKISKGQIGVGMDRFQVATAWGRPYRINKTHNAYGTSEQWVMYKFGSSYVYFEDGICTTIQN